MKKQPSPIYSKIEYENASAIKKNILNIQMNLLQTIRDMKDYQILRKKEFMYKVKLKKTLNEAKQTLTKLINSVPKTEGINLARHGNRLKEKKQEKTQAGIEAELQDIRTRLESMG